MDLPSSFNSAFCDARTAVGEPAQWGVMGCCAVNILLWLNTCMNLLLPEAMAHIAKRLLCGRFDHHAGVFMLVRTKHLLWDTAHSLPYSTLLTVSHCDI